MSARTVKQGICFWMLWVGYLVGQDWAADSQAKPKPPNILCANPLFA